jgi:hypothetical protein
MTYLHNENTSPWNAYMCMMGECTSTRHAWQHVQTEWWVAVHVVDPMQVPPSRGCWKTAAQFYSSISCCAASSRVANSVSIKIIRRVHCASCKHGLSIMQHRRQSMREHHYLYLSAVITLVAQALHQCGCRREHSDHTLQWWPLT